MAALSACQWVPGPASFLEAEHLPMSGAFYDKSVQGHEHQKELVPACAAAVFLGVVQEHHFANVMASLGLSDACLISHDAWSLMAGSDPLGFPGAELQPGWSSLRKQPVSASMLNKFQPFLNHVLRFRYTSLTLREVPACTCNVNACVGFRMRLTVSGRALYRCFQVNAPALLYTL